MYAYEHPLPSTSKFVWKLNDNGALNPVNPLLSVGAGLRPVASYPCRLIAVSDLLLEMSHLIVLPSHADKKTHPRMVDGFPNGFEKLLWLCNTVRFVYFDLVEYALKQLNQR